MASSRMVAQMFAPMDSRTAVMRKLQWGEAVSGSFEAARAGLQEHLVADCYGTVEGIWWARDVYNERRLG